jgi:hypothetical protein
VRRRDEAAPHRQRGHQDLGAQVVERRRAADHVGDGVDRADLVKVDVVDRGAMHLRLGLRQAEEGPMRARPHPFGEAGLVEQRAHARVRARRLRRVDVNLEGGRDDAAPDARPEVHVEPRDRERRERVADDLRGHAEIDERRDDHVSREAAGRIEEQHLARAGEPRKVGPCVAIVSMLVSVGVVVGVVVRVGVGMAAALVRVVAVFVIAVLVIVVLVPFVTHDDQSPART